MSEDHQPGRNRDWEPIDPVEPRAPFDLESDGESEDGRRPRKPVADWGADDLFDYVPRRRFHRSGTVQRRAGAVPASTHSTRRHSDAGGAMVTRPAHRGDVELNAGHTRSGYSPPPRVQLTIYEPAEDQPVAEAGKPARAARRERSAQPVAERLGSRPDRVAAWACALGLLLILLAVGTADAAVLPGA